MVTSNKLFENFLQVIRGTGIVKVARPIIQRIPHYILERNNHIWLSKSLVEENIRIEPKVPVSINFSKSEFNATLDWIKTNNYLWGRHQKEIKVAGSEGHYWVNAKSGENIVGIMKFASDKVFVSDYDKILQFPIDVVFLYEIRVLPEFLGRKIASYIINETCKYCRGRGYTKALSYVHAWNSASLKSFSNVRFREIKTIYFYKILGMKFLTDNPSSL